MSVYEYNEQERILKIDDKTVYFEPKENEVFKLLYEKEGEVVTSEELTNRLYNDYAWNDQYKTVVICRIRKKLGESAEITNISKVGYKMTIR